MTEDGRRGAGAWRAIGALAVSCAAVALALAAPGAEGGIAVVYPDLPEPYRGIFAKIVEGIEDGARGRVSSHAVGPEAGAESLPGDLRRRNVRVVIALGRNALKAANGLDRGIEVIGGAVVSPGEGTARPATTLSLAPDPALLFERLRQLVPTARRVVVVHDPRQTGWLIRLAQAAARQAGLELVAHEATDLREALRFYQEFFAGARRGDALWLPQDPTTVDERTVVPLVLKESWNHQVPVFSSSLGHVRRGVLFALYPNNVEMGRRLAASALGLLGDGTPPVRGMMPLRDVLTALNTRTAGHLGLVLAPRVQSSFDLLLPEQ